MFDQFFPFFSEYICDVNLEPLDLSKMDKFEICKRKIVLCKYSHERRKLEDISLKEIDNIPEGEEEFRCTMHRNLLTEIIQVDKAFYFKWRSNTANPHHDHGSDLDRILVQSRQGRL